MTKKEQYILNIMTSLYKPGINHTPSQIKLAIDIQLKNAGESRESCEEEIRETLESLYKKGLIKMRKIATFDYFLGDNQPPVRTPKPFFYV